jgi:RNA-directed DNA polymerase
MTPDRSAQMVEAFRQLHSSRDVADLLQVSFARLSYHLRNGSKGAYHRFHIPKKSGKPREIVAPISALKMIQRKLSDILYHVYEPKAPVQGFVRERSILSNARMHAGQRWVLNLDLVDFFPSIHFGRVRGMFEGKLFGFNREVATTLARICCFESKLPQGAPTSPIISNLICARLDAELRRVAQVSRCIYTRYADDIVISTSMDPFPIEIATLAPYPADPALRIGESISNVIVRNGFTINPAKSRLRSWRRRQEVTGLTVNRFPNVKRRFVKRIRAMIRAWDEFNYVAAEQAFHEDHYHKTRAPGRGRPSFLNVLNGMMGFVGMIRGKESAVYQHLRAQFDAARGQTPHDAVWVLESEKAAIQGTAFALEGVGLVTCEHVVEDDTYAWKADETKRRKVQVVTSDERIDLAILALDDEEDIGYRLPRGDSNRVQIGDTVTIFGFPNYNPGQSVQELPAFVTGFRPRSAVERFLVASPILKGYSGGPVLNSRGEVVGVAASGADPDQTDFVEYGVIRLTELAKLPGRKPGNEPPE